ncbi:(2Fe-2S)-binding protein [Clostridium sp. CF012]|uniref:(2Fe-2S)-binding protein n=1 Tax=Clostridium sp. CF012 TaxID=2843319 RepID=UPI001C0D4EBF|nr:(2Fe-2S)-binding protein [Clostridium sp. CF012]MBU3145390.1 (2Fe-2S)-binding protein [Clostridium sp. CF012]
MEYIEFKLNGENVKYDGNASNRLLDVLRDTYRLTGVKCGCKEGECGACSVIIDGKLANSCMVAMGRVQGSEVVSIEGFVNTERYKAIDKAYGDVSAVQCGFCTPGMVLATECILANNPHPTEPEIRRGISGNLCRCTGYNAIVKAIENAAKEGEGLW